MIKGCLKDHRYFPKTFSELCAIPVISIDAPAIPQVPEPIFFSYTDRHYVTSAKLKPVSSKDSEYKQGDGDSFLGKCGFLSLFFCARYHNCA